MKKILVLLLAALLVLSLVACGNTGDTETQAPGAETKAPETQEGEDVRYDASFDRNSVKDDIPTDLRFDGKTVTFLVRIGTADQEVLQYEMDVNEIMTDTLYDAIYYRNKTVEERLGVTIDSLAIPGSYQDRLTWNDTLRTAVNSQSDDFDAAAIYTSQGSVLAIENMYYNVIDFPYINLEKPWWNQNVQDELTMFDTLYYLAGDIAASEITNTFCLTYNKDLYDRFYGSSGVSLYDVVKNNEWTMDYMYDLVVGAYDEQNGDGQASDGDIVGLLSAIDTSWYEAWVPALGLSYTTMNRGIPELSFYNERTITAFDSLVKLIKSPGTLSPNGLLTTNFTDGYVLVSMTNLNAGSGYREMKDAYGVLPLPMLDKSQGGYTTTTANVASLVTILSSLPDSRKELVGATLELMAAESYKQVTPEYFEVAVKTKYAESPEDAELYDMILNSVTISFGACYGTASILGANGNTPITTLFRDVNADLVQKWETHASAYEENLKKLIDGLDDAAFKAMYG